MSPRGRDDGVGGLPSGSPPDWVARHIPALGWLRRYNRADASGDLMAGTTVAIMLVPQAMAYTTTQTP